MAKDTDKTKDGRTVKKGLCYNIAMKKKRFLLYTPHAAEERHCVDIGGRRDRKKKNK